MSDVDRAEFTRPLPAWVNGVRTGTCCHCDLPVTTESGHWPTHDATGWQCCGFSQLNRKGTP